MEKRQKIEGAIAVFAGGGGGSGVATARRLHVAGAKVVIADLDEEKGQAVAEQLGDGAVFARTNVLDEDSVRATFAAGEAIGPVRITVIVHGGPDGVRALEREGKPHPQRRT